MFRQLALLTFAAAAVMALAKTGKKIKTKEFQLCTSEASEFFSEYYPDSFVTELYACDNDNSPTGDLIGWRTGSCIDTTRVTAFYSFNTSSNTPLPFNGTKISPFLTCSEKFIFNKGTGSKKSCKSVAGTTIYNTITNDYASLLGNLGTFNGELDDCIDISNQLFTECITINECSSNECFDLCSQQSSGKYQYCVAEAVEVAYTRVDTTASTFGYDLEKAKITQIDYDEENEMYTFTYKSNSWDPTA